MATPYAPLLKALRKGGPALIKQLPKLWPLLLESNNHKTVMEFMSDLASQSPTKRLRARVELTAEMVGDGQGLRLGRGPGASHGLGEASPQSAPAARDADAGAQRQEVGTQGFHPRPARRSSSRDESPPGAVA